MKKLALIFVFLLSFTINAQHTISGTFSPSKEYSWLIAYKLKPGTQNYIADTAIKKGVFNMTIPENAPSGIYRLVYAVPQDEFYFDIIYNGKEDIEFTFSKENGIKFITSKENKNYISHFESVSVIEQKIVDFYVSEKTSKKVFSDILKQLKDTQNLYEEESKGLIAHEFISANTIQVPENYVSVQDYLAYKKKNYFNSFNFENPVLQASGFLTDKATNYVFTALPLEQMNQQETEKEIQANVQIINAKMNGISDAFKLHVFDTLWSKASANNYNKVADFIYFSYLKELATAGNNQEIINKIDIHNRLRFGAIAPDILWKEGEANKKLSDLSVAENYILIFWSSTCSHCLKEIPPLHERLKKNTKVKVIAVGLEDDEVTWKKESAKLENFHHAIALNKWDSEYAKLYDINSTPTYYILDKEKRIIAKPENDKAVIEFLKK